MQATQQALSVAGCDCGKDSLYVCVLKEPPKNLKTFARSYKPMVIRVKPDDVETLLALPVDVYVLEPTGSYSYIWIELFKRSGKAFRLVSARRVRHFCEYKGITNKADRPDAAAIAAYTLENYHDDRAFLKLERLKVRELYLQLSSVSRDKVPTRLRLGQRLGFEFPELVQTYEDSDREWLDTLPPAPIRFLAGEPVTGPYSKQREEKLAATLGTGLSEHTRELARRLGELERMEANLEIRLNAELSQPEFDLYHRIFDRFLVPPRIRAAILSRIYPFEDFLRDGKRHTEYIRGVDSRRKSGMTKRDRSEGEFKLTLGMGKILSQSGNSESWKAGGAKYARTALWLYTKSIIVIQRARAKNKTFGDAIVTLERTYRQEGLSPWLNEPLVKAVAEAQDTTVEVASLRIHYEFQITKKGDRRVSATAGRFCRMLYKQLVKEFRS